MTLEEFSLSLSEKTMPEDLLPGLQVLWQDANGNWDAAHDICNDISTETGSWLHAYLHRVEGDLSNAAYWYRKANHPVKNSPLKEEWEELATHLL